MGLSEFNKTSILLMIFYFTKINQIIFCFISHDSALYVSSAKCHNEIRVFATRLLFLGLQKEIL